MKPIAEFTKKKYLIIVFYKNDNVEVFAFDSEEKQEELFNFLDNNPSVKRWKEMQLGIDY